MNIKRMNKTRLVCNIISIIILVVFCILVDKTGSSLWKKIISKIFIFSIAALALNIVCGCLGEFALGHGGFLLIGYTVAVLVITLTKNILGTEFFEQYFYTVREGLKPLGYLMILGDVVIATVITGLFGFLVGLIALGRLRGDYLAIVTLGISLIFVNIAKNVPSFGGATGITITNNLGGSVTLYGIMLVITIFLILTFMKTRFGRSILACRDDNIAAEACGVAVNRNKVLAFTFSAMIAGLAGALYSHYNSFKPIDGGQDLSIELLIIVVLGGLGSLTGSVVSAIIIVFYDLWFCTRGWVPDFFSSNPKIIYGIILVAIMLFRPKGILGTAEFSWKWLGNMFKKLKKFLNIPDKKSPKKEVEQNG